jgi:hypothetical protein
MSTASPDPEEREDPAAPDSDRPHSGPHDPEHRDFDQEFARILDAEGLPQVPDPEAAVPAPERPEGEDAPDDDEVLLGDFEPPDPDLPPASDAMIWSWAALVGGVLIALLAAVLDAIPTWLGAVGGLASVGGLVSLLARIPTDRSGPSDGAQV